MYSMSPITNGPPSWPRSTPRRECPRDAQILDVSVLICFSAL